MWLFTVDKATKRSLCGRLVRILETLPTLDFITMCPSDGEMVPFSEAPGVGEWPQNCKYNTFSISNRTERPREVHFWP